MAIILIRLKWVLPVVGMIVFGFGCATPPPLPTASLEEIRRRDQAVGSEIAQQFESRLHFKKNQAVSIYLRKLATNLLEANPELRGAPVGIWLVQNSHGKEIGKGNKNEKWTSYALPGNRIYLSTGLLRGIEFENEIAAEIAIQFSHLVEKHALERFLKLQEKRLEELMGPSFSGPPIWGISAQIDYFGLDGVFAFSEQAEISAARMAIGLLYHAGFDARGLVSLFQRFQNNSKHSPYELSTINKIIEITRQEIALQAPLRNPIVRSQAFVKIQKRMREL